MKWNVIWQVDPNDPSSCIEKDWFEELTSHVPIGSVTVDYRKKPLLSCVAPCAIVCVSCPNQTSEQDLVSYLLRLPKPRVLYLMSDEFVEVGRDVYRNCELVLRNGSANFDLLGDPTVIQLPLGYVSGLRNPSSSYSRSSERKCAFAFLGTMKHDRETEMLVALQQLPGFNFVKKTQSFLAATRHFNHSTIAIYKNAVFVPNPKGNWNPECFRLYDALEWGCIPLIRRYRDSAYHLDYHDRVFGPHPIPTFDSWQESAAFASHMLSRPAELDALQVEVAGWWSEYKAGLRQAVAARLAAFGDRP